MTAFLLSGLMLIAQACLQYSRVLEFTWFGAAQTQLQILGFFAIVIFGAIYEILPRLVDGGLPFPKFVRLQHWLFMLGTLLLVGSLAFAGVQQGRAGFDPAAALPGLRIATLGWTFFLLGSLLFAANIFVMTIRWKLSLVKIVIAYIKSPLETSSAAAPLRREQGEVKP